MIKPEFQQINPVKILLNIGAGLDIPTGSFVKGQYGESILNGGLPSIVGVVGRGNMFKSTIMYFMCLSALNKVMYTSDSYMNTYDTEINITESHLQRFTEFFDYIKDKGILENGTWSITDKTLYFANKWYEITRNYLKEKIKQKEVVTTPFLNRDKTSLIQIPIPTFGQVDSFSEFETENDNNIQADNELGESGGNTIHMRQGLAKTRFLMDIPALAGGAYHYMQMTAHVGTKIEMASGPMAPKPKKDLQFLGNDDKIKGTTGKFMFLTNICWQVVSASKFINQGTKGPEFPRNAQDDANLDTDLNIVKMVLLRNKSGKSGTEVKLLLSQHDGVLPSLSEFYYVKEMGRFGLEGSNTNYAYSLLPDVKLSRTTVRGKLDENPQLRRVANITSEICQMKELWKHMDNSLFVEPNVLYKGLQDLGYDWNELLNTRGWWCFDNDKQPLPFLSSMDLLNMMPITQGSPRTSFYIPYWMKNPPQKALDIFKEYNGYDFKPFTPVRKKND